MTTVIENIIETIYNVVKQTQPKQNFPNEHILLSYLRICKSTKQYQSQITQICSTILYVYIIQIIIIIINK